MKKCNKNKCKDCDKIECNKQSSQQQSDITLNMEWITKNISSYTDQWITLHNGQLIAHASSLEELLKQTKGKPGVTFNLNWHNPNSKYEETMMDIKYFQDTENKNGK